MILLVGPSWLHDEADWILKDSSSTSENSVGSKRNDQREFNPDPGDHQLFTFLIFIPPAFTGCLLMASVFTASISEYRCFVNGCDDEICPNYEDGETFRNFSIPFSKEDGYSSCQVFPPTNRSTCSPENFDPTVEPTDCQTYVYSTEIMKKTIVSDWNLVCRKKYKAPLIQSVVFAGALISTITSGTFASFFGRKVSLFSATAVMGAASLGSAIAKDYNLFLIFQFLAAFGQAAVFQTAFILVIEIVGERQRVMCGIAVDYFFVFGEVYLTLFAWLFRDWRSLMLSFAVPCTACCIYLPLIPESFRWLYRKGRVEEAANVVTRIATWNKRPAPNLDDYIILEDTTSESIPSESILDFLRSKKMAVCGLVICYQWIVSTMSYYGLSLNTQTLAGNFFLNFLLSALVEIPGYVMSHFGMNLIGRRLTLSISFFLGGLSCLAGAFIPESIHWLNIILFLLGKCFVTCAFGTIFLFTTELYPTSIRPIGVGFSNMMGRISAILTPFLGELSDLGRWIPMTVIAANALLAGGLALWLPETLGRDLPETIRDLNKGEEARAATKYRSTDQRPNEEQCQ